MHHYHSNLIRVFLRLMGNAQSAFACTLQTNAKTAWNEREKELKVKHLAGLCGLAAARDPLMIKRERLLQQERNRIGSIQLNVDLSDKILFYFFKLG